jgi:hypothetical protein
MSTLDQSIAVACPLAQAAPRLKQFFREHGNAEGDTAKLSLHVDIDVPGLPLPLSLARGVIATIQPHHLPADMEPRYSVQWAPEKPGPFPLFSGELIVEGRDDYDSFTLRLRGSYTPPLGALGEGFDMAVGNRIAAAAAGNLLRRICDTINENFQKDEAEKRRPVSEPS